MGTFHTQYLCLYLSSTKMLRKARLRKGCGFGYQLALALDLGGQGNVVYIFLST